MANRLYIGARYIPLPFNNPDGSYNWLPGVAYEGLTIVIYDHRSYISKKPVPAISTPPSEDNEHWVDAYLYNADVAEALLSINELQETKADKDGIYPALWAGELISKDSQVDKTPYLFRNTGGSLKRIAPLEYPTLVGATVSVNQLLDKDSYPASSGVFTNNGDGSITANGLASSTSTFKVASAYNGFILDHVYAVIGGNTATGSGSSFEFMITTFFANRNNMNLYSEATIAKFTYAGSNAHDIQAVVRSGYTANNLTWKPNIIDLTAMLGSTIADYVYTLEQATAGSGIAWLRSYGFLNGYQAYNSGSIESVEATAKVVRDENGENAVTYPLGNDVLRGIFKLDVNNKLYADGDRKTSDGTVTRKYGVVDLGTLNWTMYETNYLYANLPGAKIGLYAQLSNAMCSKYVQSTMSHLFDKTFAVNNGQPRINIYDSAYSDAATFKTAMNGVMLVYELATPTTEQSTPFTSPQIVYPDGTEEFVTENGVPVGHETEYPYDLVGLVENLINIPDVPSTNGTYKLQAVRTSSGVTYEWVSD